MDQRSLGSLRVSEVGLGCNNFGTRLDQDATTSVVLAALDVGINFFDTADIYGDLKSEVQLGVALGSRRGEAVIASKFGMLHDMSGFCATPDYVRQSCDESLRRLGTDVIDLYQLHFPDETTPIDETIGAMQELVALGKVREIGCSNFTAAQLREANLAAGDGPRFVSVQSQFSLLDRSPEYDGVLQACNELGIGFLPFYPLANGLLTGKVRPGEPIPQGSRLAAMPDDLLDFADDQEVTILSFAFSWLLCHPAVSSVIAGASNADQVNANAHAVRGLTAEQLHRLDELTSN